MTAEGWAVIDDNGINVKTISETRLSAIVNWLCVEKEMLSTQLATDEDIERAWRVNCRGAIASRVSISAESH